MKKLFLASTLFLTIVAANISGMLNDYQDNSYLYDQGDQTGDYSDNYQEAPNRETILDYIATHKNDESNISDSDPDATEVDEPEAIESKEEQAKTNPDIDELNNPKVKLQEFLATVYESLKINISCDTKLMDTKLYVPALVTQALDKFKETDKRSSTDQKMAPEQQMRYNTLLYLVQEILLKYGLKITLSGNTYLIEKTDSKTSDKN